MRESAEECVYEREREKAERLRGEEERNTDDIINKKQLKRVNEGKSGE